MAKIYVETKEGSFSIEGMSIPAAEDNRHYQQMLEEVEAGEARLAPYVEPVKTLEQLQQEAIDAMASVITEECRSGTGKLYFSNIESAAMYTSVIQEDAEIRARAEELMLWSFAIDTYALDVLFSIKEGGDTPTIEEFIAGLPTV